MAYTLTSSRLFWGLITGISIGGRQLGWTGNQVTISLTTATQKLEGGQSRLAADELLLSKEYKATFSLREFTIKNMATALGLPAAAVAVNESSADGETTQPEEVVMKIEFLNEVNSKYMLFTVPRARFAGNGSASIDRDQQGDMPVEYSWFDDGTGRAFAVTESDTSTW